MSRRLERLEAAMQGENPRVHFVPCTAPPGLSPAEHVAWHNGTYCFTLDLGRAAIDGADR